jgi:hypothetical protein
MPPELLGVQEKMSDEECSLLTTVMREKGPAAATAGNYADNMIDDTSDDISCHGHHIQRVATTSGMRVDNEETYVEHTSTARLTSRKRVNKYAKLDEYTSIPWSAYKDGLDPKKVTLVLALPFCFCLPLRGSLRVRLSQLLVYVANLARHFLCR